MYMCVCVCIYIYIYIYKVLINVIYENGLNLKQKIYNLLRMHLTCYNIQNSFSLPGCPLTITTD